jgi:HlyD family secretion protein
MAKQKRSGLKFLVFLGVLAGGAYGAHRAGWTDELLAQEEIVLIQGSPVRRGDLRISEVVRGNLEAKDSASIRSQLEGRSTIITLAKEGSRVEKGDLVAELDVTTIINEKERQDIVVQQAELDVTQATKQVEIQVIQERTDMAAAQLDVDLAALDLKKYEDEKNGDWFLELKKAEETVTIKEEEMARAKNELEWTEKLAADGFIQKNQLEADRLALQRTEIEHLQAQRDLEAKIEYGNLRKLAELNAEVENRKNLLEKTKKQSEAKMADLEAALHSASYKLAREREKLAKLEDQIAKGKLYAPESGLIVYSREQGRMGNTEVIQEGQEVRERQELLTIPRAGGMVAKASIHETKLKKIRMGQQCLITVEAFPNRVFNGRVDFVAVMADSGSWRTNPNTRLYKADITLTDAIPEMRPGMSCNVEILIEDLKSVLYVPRQCVLLDGGETIVFVQEGDNSVRRVVEVGLDNAKWVSLVSGVKEGDTVLLAPPASFDPAPAPEVQADPNAAPLGAAAAMAPTDEVPALNGAGDGGAPAFGAGRPRGEGGAPDAARMRGEGGGFDPARMRGEGGGTDGARTRGEGGATEGMRPRGEGGTRGPRGQGPPGATGTEGSAPRGRRGGAPAGEGAAAPDGTGAPAEGGAPAGGSGGQ